MNQFAMGNESSQLERSGAGPQHAARTIGPSMSPTPEPENGESTHGRGAAGSSHALDVEPIPDDLPGKKKKRKKHRKDLEADVATSEVATTGQEDDEPSHPKKKSKKKKSKRKELEPEAEEEMDEAVIEDTQPEPELAETPSSPKRKKKKSKKHGSRVDGPPLPNGQHQKELVNGIRSDEDANAVLENGTQVEDALPSLEPQQGFLDDADGGSPPSAQPPRFNHEPSQSDEEDEEDAAIIPSSQWQPSRRESSQSLEPSQQLKREVSESEDGDQPLDPSQLKKERSESQAEIDEYLQSQFAGIAAANFAEAVTDPVAEAMRERDPENGLGWLHKRENASQETPITDTRTAHQRSVDASLPDLQPSQVKTEPDVDSDTDSGSDKSTESGSTSKPDSDSPSAQRSERLSRSRSRSASRAPGGYLADQALGIVENARPEPYSQIPYSAPSSTGSNRSIPARLPSPSSTGSNRSIPARLPSPSNAGSNHTSPAPVEPGPSLSVSKSGTGPRLTRAKAKDAVANGDVMDVDSPVVPDASPPKRRAKKVAPAKAKVTAQPEVDEVAADNGEPVATSNAGVADKPEAITNGDAMDIDEASVPERPITEVKRATRAALNRKNKPVQPTQAVEVDTANNTNETMDANTATDAAKPKKQTRKTRSSNDMADRNVHVMANWLGGSVNGAQQSEAEDPAQNGSGDDELPLEYMTAAEELQPVEPVVPPKRSQRRQPKASLAEKGATAPAEATSGPEVEKSMPAPSQKKGKGRASRGNAPTKNASHGEAEGEGAGQDATTATVALEDAEPERRASIEPGESASQPQPTPKSKGKKKRILNQPKVSLSLSQMIDPEDEEDFSAVFSRRNSTKTPAAGGSNVPDQSQRGPSQVPSPVRPRKVKRRKRGVNDASEDEMESILAAGPSKSRKRSGAPDLSDDEDARSPKRKRLATAGNGKASGAWGQDELDALKRVVDSFREGHSMTQEEVNNMVHEVPNKADSVNKELWDKADMAVPRRTRKQIIERARRVFHNFAARGTWTDEQKEEIHELFESHPNKWGEIAKMINRHQQDVRDYWRNHYLVYQSQTKARWNKDEEERLKEVVEEAISKIRIQRENNDQLRPRPRTKKTDDEAMLDWQQISAAMDLTRSRQQCKWKWIDMREKGVVGDDSIRLPSQPRRSTGPRGNGISEELANAREDYRGMGPEEKFRLIDAIKDSGAREDKNIPWRSLVDERFRLKWHRPALRLVWYRMRQTCPNYEKEDVEANARHLVNFYHMHQSLPHFDEATADDALEELIVQYNRGKRVWKRPSQDPRAVKARQRRASSASSRANSRVSQRVSSEILNLSGDEKEDEEGATAPTSRSRQSTELGEQEEDRGRRARSRLNRADASTAASLVSDDLEVTIPGHLKGQAAKKVLEQARAKAKGKGKARAIDLDGAAEKSRGARSNSVAIDSDSEG